MSLSINTSVCENEVSSSDLFHYINEDKDSLSIPYGIVLWILCLYVFK